MLSKKYILIIFILLTAFIVKINAAEGPLSIVQEGQNLFMKGMQENNLTLKNNYLLRAIAKFQQATEQGPNGHLYYNIANAYYQMDNFGKAILFYRKAEKYIPDDHDLQYNLKQARLKVSQTIQPVTTAWDNVWRILCFWHYSLAYQTRANITWFAYLLFWLLLIFKLWKKNSPNWLIYICLIFFIVMGASSGISLYERYLKPYGVITVKESEAYQGPGFSYAKSFTEPLKSGTEVIIKQYQNHWVKVILANNTPCWLIKDDITAINY